MSDTVIHNHNRILHGFKKVNKQKEAKPCFNFLALSFYFRNIQLILSCLLRANPEMRKNNLIYQLRKSNLYIHSYFLFIRFCNNNVHKT
jgi:hypothetical protein